MTGEGPPPGDPSSDHAIPERPRGSRPQLFGALGQFFFHYTTADTAFTYILPTGTLRMSPYTHMSDPMEAKEWRFVPQGPTEFPMNEHVERSLNPLRAQCCLLSLTVDAEGYTAPDDAPFGRGYGRARLWERYGDNHAGVCLCFARPDLEQRARDALGNVEAKAVRYTPGGRATSPAMRLPDFRVAERMAAARRRVRELLDNGLTREAEEVQEEAVKTVQGEIAEYAAEFLGDHGDELFFLKTDDWQSEREYRIFTILEEPGYAYVPYGPTLRAVIVGERFPESEMAAAERACSEAGVELRRMAWPGGSPHAVLVAEAPGS